MSEEKSRRYAPDLMAGQVALVTGSGSGMGRATALEMASCGARLALFARREEPLEETAEMIRAAGGEAFVVPGDTRDEDSIETAMERIKDHYGQLDVLVNNAGGQYIAAARDITNKGFEAVIRNNLIGSWQMTRAVADHFMYDNGGSVVFVTAISARTALTGFTHTVAARAGVTGMMKTLAAEWGEYGIRLNCVAPGTIKTDALGRYPISPEQWKKLNRSVLNRMGMAEDIAGTIIFLASDLGNFITGEDIYVDGGETLHMGHDARDMINPDMFEKRERGDGKNE
ncbi:MULTISPECIES: SDR family NAD(P)-dependent oxidoreductase [Rhodobacterales]|uniref:SDR family NAD(P)-dependent oxidoreductase n=1 Tax=Rhodobacterales TaxID=204455 RepID=UPI000C103EFF|nr:SDR family oxidoreductase [Heliomarina baculiformis]MAM25513.1 short-chain dehydrogenase [Paracoccaceae bacterium]MBO27968.1 short-chain dehydrogenase [Paracoccaceae bacterium]GLT12471.1 short-chain dehydrogenase [Sulfitobacter porphyrae]|tara:strand:- start:158 stop:1012 length:855 start_codon:yes stop_codon:yes gene_type:complete